MVTGQNGMDKIVCGRNGVWQKWSTDWMVYEQNGNNFQYRF